MAERIRFESELADLGLAGGAASARGRTRDGAFFERETPAGQAAFGVEIDLAEQRFEKTTKYGKWNVSATLKTKTSVGGSTGLPVGGSTTLTSKANDGKREKGAKQDFAYAGFKNALKGLRIENLLLELGGEWSGTEIAAHADAKFDFVTKAIGRLPVKVKINLFRLKEGEKPKIGVLEAQFSTPSFVAPLPGAKTEVFIRYKISWTLDKAKVGREIVIKLAKDKLKKEAKKQGLIWLGRRAGQEVVKKLGPLVTAFSIGWDIGKFLNENTVADEVALDLQKEILGDFNERYHRAGTLGKMFLIARNAPRLVAALVASGFVGAAAGIGDLILFKIFGLDKLEKRFEEMYERFRELKALIPDVGGAFGDMVLASALRMGIKFNPKYGRIAQPDVRALAAAVYKALKPIYGRRGGLQQVIDLKMQDVLPDGNVDYHRRVADYIRRNKFVHDSIDGRRGRDEVLVALLEANLITFLQLLEKYRLIAYTVTFSDDLSSAGISQELVDELFI